MRPKVILSLFLTVVMGVGPLFLIYALFVRPNWTWAQRLSYWSGQHWAWTGTLALGVTLGVWLFVDWF